MHYIFQQIRKEIIELKICRSHAAKENAKEGVPKSERHSLFCSHRRGYVFYAALFLARSLPSVARSA